MKKKNHWWEEAIKLNLLECEKNTFTGERK